MTPSPRTLGLRRRTVVQLLVIALVAVAFGAYRFWRPSDLAPLPPDTMSPNELITLGKAVYAQHCATCHGVNLEGQPNWKRRLPTGGFPAPPHDASGHTWHHPDRLLFKITKYGGQADAPRGFRSNMPAFEKVLSDTEIWAVLAYIKSQWPPEIQAQQARMNRPQR